MCNTLNSRRYAAALMGGIFWLFSGSSIVFAQLDATVFEDFSQTIINPYLLNPSATDSSYSFKICANNINQLGIFRNVNRFYVDADKRIASSKPNSFHFIGAQVLNAKFGDFISRSRMQARYSWFSQVSKKAFLSSGVSLGFINYAFLTTQGGTGGSAYAPDGMIGIHYIRPRTSLGFGIQQLFNPVLIPVNQSFRLNRLYNIDFSQRIDLGLRTSLTGFGVIQKQEKGSILYSAGMLMNLSDVVLIGLNNFSLKKTSVNFGVHQIRFLGMKFMFMTTYSIYHSTIISPDSTFELFIALQK